MRCIVNKLGESWPLCFLQVLMEMHLEILRPKGLILEMSGVPSESAFL
jgi:hypothetical protein